MSSEVMQRLDEVRRRAGSQLSSSGSAQDVRADVQQMANMALSLSDKYRHIEAETMLRDNAIGSNRLEVTESLNKLVKALSILEKYGCNLTNPNRPRFWRSVKHNNPVFRASVDAIKGGRAVLHLYGYTSQQIDGLSFPDDVSDPDVPNVSALTLEVMTLRSEMDMLIKETHPHPELFKDIVPLLVQHLQQEELTCDAVVIPPEETQGSWASPSTPRPAETQQQQQQQQQPNTISTVSPPVSECNLCGATSTLLCIACGHLGFCDACDDFFHRHPSRAVHQRDVIHKPMQGSCSICGISSVNIHCSTCGQKLCVKCDRLYHSHPDRTAHNRTTITPAKPSSGSPSLSPWECSHCTTVNEVRAVLCATCERPRLATATSSAQEESMSVPSSPSSTEWQCKSCTVVNQGSSILCEVCERPRLATRPPVITPLSSIPGSLGGGGQWVCQGCTYVNVKPTLQCEMCGSPCKEPAAASLVERSPSREPSPPQPKPRVQEPSPPQPTPRVQEPSPPQPKPRVHPDLNRQKLMRDDGLKLMTQIREAEKRGFTPEEAYAALCVCGGSDINPCDWLTSELPHLLDEICAMALSVQQNYNAGDSGTAGTGERDGGTLPPCSPNALQLSRAEAKQAWLAVGGDTEKAVTQLLRDRQAKMRELRALGFRETSQCEEALRLSGGDIREALSLLQRPLLEPFHQRIWSEQPEVPFDAKHPDKQRLCRRLLALYELPSWGRCELALSLLQEEEVSCSLEDVVQVVKESQDRDFIRRVLNNQCPCCFCNYPRSKMQCLTSCQCSVCQECFSQHFTITVKEKHIRDMVCPVCAGPDINDAEQLDSYFSTLDIQLKACLENDVYNLYHKKLTEHTLMMDPKFLWCCLCTFGFIYDGDQLKVTCPSCNKSFCSLCKKPWEVQHQDMSCDQFQQWKRENDPEYQKQGLACFLRDNGITCPNCRFQYALTKGGCIHFSCSQCRYQFCSGCNNPFHTTACKTAHCKITGLHAHHPRDCLFYLRDWDPARLQALLQRNVQEFNTDPPNGTQTDACGVMEQKDEAGQQMDSPCGIRTQPDHAGLCEKHYKEYLVSLINSHSLDPAILYDDQEMAVACDRYQVDLPRAENEEENVHAARLLKKLMEVPLGEKVPGRK